MLPSYIKAEFDNPNKFKVFYKNFYIKIPFIPWMNILNFKEVNSTYDLDKHVKDLAHMFLFFIYLSVPFISLYI